MGARRYTRLRAAALAGQSSAPLDARCFGKRKSFENRPEALRKRSLIVEYLEEIRNSIAEPTPEANRDVKTVRPSNLQKNCDRKLQKRTVKMSFRRHRGKRPRAAASIHWGRASSEDMRLLPPGFFSEYYRLFMTRHPTEKISLKLFLAAALMCSICDVDLVSLSPLGLWLLHCIELRFNSLGMG